MADSQWQVTATNEKGESMKADDVIRVGDLVMVVEPLPCCGNESFLWLTFVVKRIRRSSGFCVHCHCYHSGFAYEDGERYAYDRIRLKKISPRPLSESANTSREVVA